MTSPLRLEDSIDKGEFDRWIDDARLDRLSDRNIADLAQRLAASGKRLRGPKPAADLASTGGPGSLSTLLSPLALVASGFSVPKLGVPGRPAGGVDVLSQIPGYSVRLDHEDAQKILSSCGYVHALAGSEYAPADAALFEYRQKMSAQALPALVIASLLSKKLAMGVDALGLEVRVGPHGNLGHDLDAARANAQRFCRVAAMCSIEATCFLTDGSVAQQPFIGRGEALMAIWQLLTSRSNRWLSAHASDCLNWSATLTRSPVAKWTRIADAFASNVVAQGGSLDGFYAKVAEVTAAHTRTVDAVSDGYVRYDLGKLRSAILSARGPDLIDGFIDTAGLILLVEDESFVETGASIISVRCGDEMWDSFSAELANAIEVAEEPRGAGSRGTLEVLRV
ncbi:hypothetical protein X766_21750 [Mesorhizobium sp. LSJC255A00]|uniref:hypothetical protein n=1 Tax=Mesorhizobium sp. LSJC255A00 TaxID=1287313 RepID=UPI0003CDE6F6|nr:hypothetical protein [Mesorhizobium sp. LSJC255A00]ESX16687.1 hypothetical protein X766_21750 [Mesorhizobium sp. LSJC255A00]